MSEDAHDRPTGTGQPPHSDDAERAVLGAALLRAEAVDRALEVGLRPEDFYRPVHGALFARLCEMRDAQEPIDDVTVDLAMAGRARAPAVGKADPSWRAYCAHLRQQVPTAENASRYARQVVATAKLREVIRRAEDAATSSAAAGADPDAILDTTLQGLFEVQQRGSGSAIRPIRTVLHDVLRDLSAATERAAAGNHGISGVATGIGGLDRLTGGMHAGELTLLASRPSLGKTSLAVQIARHVACELKLPVMFFSLEMSTAAVIGRLLYAGARVDSNRARAGYLDADDWARLVQAGNPLAPAPLYLDDGPAQTIAQIRSKARRFRANREMFRGADLGLVVIDYLQLVRAILQRGRHESREQEVAAVSAGMKAMAKELGLPVLALAQLGRRSEEREGPPRLSDLRESGSLEQDADVVEFIAPDRRGDDGMPSDACSIIVAKQRNGPLGEVPMVFLRTYTTFVERTDAIGSAPSSAKPTRHRKAAPAPTPRADIDG